MRDDDDDHGDFLVAVADADDDDAEVDDDEYFDDGDDKLWKVFEFTLEGTQCSPNEGFVASKIEKPINDIEILEV